jgi:hypothetical protein
MKEKYEEILRKLREQLSEELIQEGRNQVLYLMLCIGDENVAHDNWHPEKADVLLEARLEIVERLKHPRSDGVQNTVWPREWPDFEKYTYCPG